MPITLKELAEISGCSIRTVSRALSRSGPVAEEKRLLIESLARKYHYTPNMVARNLKTAHRNVVGVITAPGEGLLSRKLIDLTVQLEQRGFYPLLTGSPANSAQLNNVLRSWSGLVESVIFYHTGFLKRPMLLDARNAFDLRFIIMDAPGLRMEGITSLEIDRAHGIVEAIDALVSSGHRRILRWGVTAGRDGGWSSAAAKYPELKFMHIERNSYPEQLEKFGEEVLQAGADALFCDTDRGATGFLRFAVSRGIRIPQTLSLVGFDDEPFDRLLSTPLASVAQPIHEINAAAAEIAAGKPAPAEPLIFPTRYVARASVSAKIPQR